MLCCESSYCIHSNDKNEEIFGVLVRIAHPPAIALVLKHSVPPAVISMIRALAYPQEKVKIINLKNLLNICYLLLLLSTTNVFLF